MIRPLLLAICLALPLPALAEALFTDDLGRQVAVPDHPLRIVSLYDIDLTIPLLELGVVPVGSHGRLGRDGRPELRSGALLTGLDFDNADMAFVGANTLDLEKILALKPDLIVAELSRSRLLPQLSRIAPTVVLDSEAGAPHVYAALARLTGTEARLAQLERRYQAGLARLRATVHPETKTVAVLQPLRGRINVYHRYRALGRVLEDAGFRFVPLIEAIPEGDRISISPERLPELDADYIFDPYRADQGKGPAAETAMLEEMLPGFCDYLEACRAGRFILLPREEAISNSYAAMTLILAELQASFGRHAPAPAPTPTNP